MFFFLQARLHWFHRVEPAWMLYSFPEVRNRKETERGLGFTMTSPRPPLTLAGCISWLGAGGQVKKQQWSRMSWMSSWSQVIKIYSTNDIRFLPRIYTGVRPKGSLVMSILQFLDALASLKTIVKIKYSNQCFQDVVTSRLNSQQCRKTF